MALKVRVAATQPKPTSTSILGSFKLSNEVEEKTSNSATQKFAEMIDRQIEYAQLIIDGKELPAQGGEQRKLTPRLMFWEKKGDFFLTVRYGATPVDMTGDKSLLKVNNLSVYKERAKATITAGKNLQDVQATLEQVKKAAIDTKELEALINHLSSLIGERLQVARNARK